MKEVSTIKYLFCGFFSCLFLFGLMNFKFIILDLASITDHNSIRLGFPLVFYERSKADVINEGFFRRFHLYYLIADALFALIISGLIGYYFKLYGINSGIRQKYEQ